MAVMTDSVLTQTFQKIKVTEVEDVQVTEIVDDSGKFLRAIRVFGMPGGTEAAPIIELQIQSATAEKIKVTTPEIDF
jgi:hypothetical protein